MKTKKTRRNISSSTRAIQSWNLTLVSSAAQRIKRVNWLTSVHGRNKKNCHFYRTIKIRVLIITIILRESSKFRNNRCSRDSRIRISTIIVLTLVGLKVITTITILKRMVRIIRFCLLNEKEVKRINSKSMMKMMKKKCSSKAWSERKELSFITMKTMMRKSKIAKSMWVMLIVQLFRVKARKSS